MERKIEDMSNNEILFLVKQLEADHESIKLKMLQDYEKMVDIEKQYDQANKLISKRLKKE
jgi:hypothetical protein